MYTTKDLMLSLKEFMAKDSLDKAYPVIKNSSLADLVSAWSTIPVSWEIPNYFDEIRPSTPDNEYTEWELLWEYCSFNKIHLQVASGLTPGEVDLQFERAKMLRLIYPNGLISPSARQVLALKVSEEIGKGLDGAEKLKNSRNKKG